MNDTSNSPTPEAPELPELAAETIDRIEAAVLTEVATEPRRPDAGSPRRRSRARAWLTAGGVAAAFVVGVMVTPPILGIVGTSGSMVSATDGGAMPSTLVTAPEMRGEAGSSADMSASLENPADGREIIANASATLEVDDIAAGVAAIGALAEQFDGYVESTDVSRPVAVDGSMTMPEADGYGWISIRVPAEDLADVIAALGDTGDVVASSISRQDVTSTAIDLRARVESTRASVQRLTELMAQSGTVSELIEAEVALTDRQAQLESYEQQLAGLEDQIAMSSLQVQLTRATTPTTADPAGFADGLLAGWNGLVVSLNALVIAAGFLLPWLGVVGLVVLVIWLIRRSRRARQVRRQAEDR